MDQIVKEVGQQHTYYRKCWIYTRYS